LPSIARRQRSRLRDQASRLAGGARSPMKSIPLFEQLLSRCNDVGLLAEKFDPVASHMLGNFPQAFSHVGLINCALNLTRQDGPAEERAEQ